ncbi:SDR family oxidoreductase [Clostridium cylindrosporum]|uniref:dTDP-4-dehydrorhamnose reductase n=1 Tax=Clostridium cylindrosporum DSM 605 TaxID=1121307 RepID=A0A0J8D9C0_CLOCY|nr:SDR family oxidoreductase [Clostridium cylindrosporum]KMT22630.1 spore coat polysaccharide biosynthesis protein SpsK [Clostridium cylindrosporum DSM 605]
MKKVLIIGASGFLGRELYKTIELDTTYKVYGTYSKGKIENLEHLDVSDLESINNVFSKIQPNIVIITAALTNVEYCERNREETYRINVLGIENIVKECKKYNCRIIYISTEYVFDGINGPYDEIAEVNPINYYGETKLLGEKIILKETEEYLIIRTTVVYGWDLQSKNFIMQLIKSLSENKSMKVPVDQISSPTYCPNLAEMIKECCDKNIKGVFNIVGSEIMDRYTFAIKAADTIGLNKELLIPIKTELLGQVANRPLNAGLKVEKVLETLQTKPISVGNGLKEVRKHYIEYKKRPLEEAIYE